MFSKLRNKIIIITMATTTAVLFLAGCSIMFFSSMIRPEPKMFPEPNVIEVKDFNSQSFPGNTNQELNEYIRTDRREGSARLLVTLLSVGAIIELLVFVITFFLSKKIVEPVKDSYDKQRLFIANASHELKTPLAVIQANMEALDVDKKNEKWKNNVEVEINHANKLVLDLLQLARMDAGNVSQNPPEKINLKVELKKHIEMFKPKFSGKVILKTETDDYIHELSRQDFCQAIDILLDNATKYGAKKVTVLLGDDSVSVMNDGAIIPKDERGKVFDRFYQVDKTKEGSGLGLAIAKAICEQNNWNIVCENENNLTKFKISFI